MKARSISTNDRICKEVQRLLALGWTLVPGKKHRKVRSPNGETLAIPLHTGCPRAASNWIAEVRLIETGHNRYRRH